MFARHKSTIGSKFHFYVSRFKFGKSAFLPARRSKCKHGICYGDVAGWLAGCLSVTRRYCIKTDKPVLKLFRPSGSPIILVSYDPCTDTQFQGYPRALQRARALNTHGVGKIGDFRAIFDGNCRLFSGAR